MSQRLKCEICGYMDATRVTTILQSKEIGACYLPGNS